MGESDRWMYEAAREWMLILNEKETRAGIAWHLLSADDSDQSVLESKADEATVGQPASPHTRELPPTEREGKPSA